MPQLFALEWDPREIRLMVASGHGRQVVIEHAFSIPYEIDASAADSAEQIGRLIASELDARGLGRGEAVVAVGRNSIELRQLQLPPAPDEDLPDMVRFQATREFNELDDKWLLDFIPIEGSATTPRIVLATAIGPAVLKHIESVCEHAGLKMLRLLLRPCEAASLLVGEESVPRGQVVLLVNFLGLEADLTAVADGTAVFLRTTRIGGDPPPLPALVAEIRLTMAAASNQLGGRRIESIVLCGGQGSDRDLALAIEKELGIHVEVFDPLGGVKLGRALVESPPTHSGRFAPLAGMLVAELKPAAHAVDFLHPRRRAPPADPRKKWIIAGACAATLLLGWLIYGRVTHSMLVGETNDLAQKSKAMDELLPRAKEVHASTAEIAKWADGEVIWLDRLVVLNESFPPAQQAVLGQLNVSSGTSGGQVDLKGWVSRRDDMESLHKAIRDHGCKMLDKADREDHSVAPYTWSFEISIVPEKDQKP